MLTLVEEGSKSTCIDLSRRGHLEPKRADLDQRRHLGMQSAEVSTPVREGSKSTRTDLGRRGHLEPKRANLDQRRHPSMQSPEVLTLIGEGSKSICTDLGRRGHLSLNEPTLVREGLKSYTRGQGPSDLTKDPHATSNEPR